MVQMFSFFKIFKMITSSILPLALLVIFSFSGDGYRLNKLKLPRLKRVCCVHSKEDYIPTEIEPATFSGTGSVLLVKPGEYDHFLMKV